MSMKPSDVTRGNKPGIHFPIIDKTLMIHYYMTKCMPPIGVISTA